MNLFDRLAQAQEPSAIVEEEQSERSNILKFERIERDAYFEQGKLIDEWKRLYAYGRSDDDYASMLCNSMSGESIRQRRRVFEKFYEFRNDFPFVMYSHWVAALSWEDWPGMIRWVNQQGESGIHVSKEQFIREHNRRHGRGESILDTTPPWSGKEDQVKDGRTKKKAQPVQFEKREPLAVVDETFQVGASTKPVKELKPDSVIMALRQALKPVADYADDETRQEIGDELRSWLARIQPKVSLPTSDEIKELITIPIFMDAWNKAEGTPFTEKLTAKKEEMLKSLLDDDNWRSTWKIGLQKVSVLAKKFKDWEPDVGWFLQPKTVKSLIEGKFDDKPPNDNKPFTKPTIEEVRQYCLERQNGIDPEYWWNFYEAKNWMIGKNKMVKWKMAVITWEKDNPKPSSSPAPFRPSTNSAASRIDDILKRGDEEFRDFPENEVPF